VRRIPLPHKARAEANNGHVYFRCSALEPPNHRRRVAGTAHRRVAAQAKGPGADPFAPGLAIHQYGLGPVPKAP